jgi:hypothetical protein
MISARTKAALETAKARGVRLGNPDGFVRVDIAKGRQLGLAARQTQSTEFRNQMMSIIQGIKGLGIATVRGIADELVVAFPPCAAGAGEQLRSSASSGLLKPPRSKTVVEWRHESKIFG